MSEENNFLDKKNNKGIFLAIIAALCYSISSPLSKLLLGQSSNEVMAVVTEIPWEQVVRFAHLLQSCYRSEASTPVLRHVARVPSLF